MKWPWISRARYYDDTNMIMGSCSQYAGMCERWEERYDALLEKYHALKLSGASIPEPKPEPAPPKEPDVVTQAIISKAGSSRQLRKQFSEYVNEQRNLGATEADIAAAIIAGVSDDGGIPG